MAHEFSIAEAKDHLSEVVRLAEEEGTVELTRRGKSVAVVVSAREFRRLCYSSSKPFAFLEEFRNSHDADHHGLEPGDLDGVRDQHPGRVVRR
ncbi:MAG: type II toxin-antitoxin system Phd/YefM family antitoxin [Actinobacteria bacterium]|nr:type II toxin-antitoxin system Phd/YefM family antitoxin [Actinomycetota bacterium]